MILTSYLPACQPADAAAVPVENVSGKATTLNTVLADAAPMLTAVARRLYGNLQDAGDLVQDTVERAMRTGLPAEVHNPRAWLAKMMHNLFIDRCRARARVPEHEQLADEVHEVLANVTPLNAQTEPEWTRVSIDDVRTALAAIDAPFREVYVLHTFEHKSYEEIAAHLKISRVTVGTRLTRTRKMLRKALVKQHGLGTKR